MMNENLMLVDKEGYETCTVNKTRDPRLNRMILRCDGDASKLKFTQETFSRHRVGTHRVPYYEGKTYYFICKYCLWSRPDFVARRRKYVLYASKMSVSLN